MNVFLEAMYLSHVNIESVTVLVANHCRKNEILKERETERERGVLET